MDADGQVETNATHLGIDEDAEVGALHHPVLRVVVRRLTQAVPLLFVVSALVFLLMALDPGDVTNNILGSRVTSGLPPSAYAELRHQLGIDQPLPEQYWHWLSRAFHGNLGQSLETNQPVIDEISPRYPVTLSLGLGALLLSLIVGISLGVASSVRSGTLSRIVDVTAMTGWIIPVYWLAAELVVIFAVKLKWLPVSGYVPLTQSVSGWLRSIVLPVVALSLGPIGLFAKFTREAMRDCLSSDYIRMARAAGVSSSSIVLRHAFKTAAIQVVTVAGLVTVSLLVGTVFVENVFALPGLGSLAVNAVGIHDVTTVQGVVVLFTLVIVVVNLLVDLSYGLLSPKVTVR